MEQAMYARCLCDLEADGQAQIPRCLVSRQDGLAPLAIYIQPALTFVKGTRIVYISTLLHTNCTLT